MIDVYDDKFSYNEIKTYYNSLKTSYFVTGGSDESHSGDEVQIHSRYTEQDSLNMGLVKTEFFQKLVQAYQLDKRKMIQTRVNLTTNAEKNRIHSDGRGLTFIYYANPEWKLEWGGHTLIMDSHNKEVEKTIIYKPGRCVIFDASLPHMIMTPSNMCPTVRYTYVIQYGNVER